MGSIVRALVGVAAAVAISGCGESLTGAAALSVAGSWSGTVNNSSSGQGTIALTLVQSGATVSGTWTTNYPGFVNGTSAGLVTGKLVGSGVSVTMFPSSGTNCPANATGTVAGQTISGTFAVFDCPAAAGGTFSVTKQ